MSRKGIIITLLLTLTASALADVKSLGRAGNSHFQRQKYEEALSFYQRAEVLEPDNLRIHYNIGNTLYRLGRFPEAVQELSLAIVDKNPLVRSQAFYNLGNTFFRMNRLDDAINAYKMALLANPKDRQAKENLEFCLKKKQEQSQSPDSTQQEQKQKSGENQQEMQQPQSKPTQGEMDREQAERILQAIENKEKQTQKEARRPKGRRQVEKDW